MRRLDALQKETTGKGADQEQIVAFTADIEYLISRDSFRVLKNPTRAKAWETWLCPECKTIRPSMRLRTDVKRCELCGWAERRYDA